MRKLPIALAVTCAWACACGKSKPEPFKGPLTVDAVMSAKDLVKPFQDWDDAFAELQAKLGPPTRISGEKHEWAAIAGDDCAYFYVEKTDGKKYKKDGMMVGAVQSPFKYGKNGDEQDRGKCLELAGKSAPEDPNAAGPPTDGSAVQVQTFLANVVPGRAKWSGKAVRVIGMLNSSSGHTYYVYDLTDTDHKHGVVSCNFDTPDPRPLVGNAVIAQGTVALAKTMDHGEPSFTATLEHCTMQVP